MQNKQLPPFERGDEVIDDNAEIGYILENYIDATWDADGNLTNWHTRIHYRWDQPSYGNVRVVSEGEIRLLTPHAPDGADRAATESGLYNCQVCGFEKCRQPGICEECLTPPTESEIKSWGVANAAPQVM